MAVGVPTPPLSSSFGQLYRGGEAVSLVSSSCAQGGVEEATQRYSKQKKSVMKRSMFAKKSVENCQTDSTFQSLSFVSICSDLFQDIISKACSSWLEAGCSPGSLGVVLLGEIAQPSPNGSVTERPMVETSGHKP